MEVIRNNKEPHIKFSQLKPGDTFIDPVNGCHYGVEMKIEYGDVYTEFRDFEGGEGFASVALETGNVFFYLYDFDVIPIKLKAVEE